MAGAEEGRNALGRVEIGRRRLEADRARLITTPPPADFSRLAGLPSSAARESGLSAS